MEEQEKKELDLFDVLRIFFKSAKIAVFAIFSFFTWLFRFLFQVKWILLGAIVCGVLFSLFWSKPDNLFYKGETEMRFNIYDAYFYKNQFNLLNSYCEDENRTSLSNALQITMAEAYNLVSINSCFIIDLRSDGTPDEVDYANSYDAKKDTINSRMGDRLMIVVFSKDTAIYSNLLVKIKAFLESNSIVSAENAIRLRHIDEKIVALDNEIYLLDSLRKKEYFKKESDTYAKLDQTILLSEKERRLYHDDILGLEGSKQGLRWEKEIRPDGVRFLAPFRIDPKPVNRLTRSLVRFIPPFSVLGFFVALAWRFRKEVYKFLSEK
jgi:hypothetical protein